MKTLERNGLYIPKEIFEIEKISWADKILLSEIYHLDKLPKGCFASNAHFAKLLGIAPGTASKKISKLCESGIIRKTYKYKNGGCLGKEITYLGCKRKTVVEDKESSTESQEQTYNQTELDDNLSLHEKKIVVPIIPGSGAQMNRGVVPKRQGGSAPGNTNNTMKNTSINKPDNNTNEKKQLMDQNTGRKNYVMDEYTRSLEMQALNSSRIGLNYSLGVKEWEEDLIKLGPEEFLKKYKHIRNKDRIQNLTTFYKRLQRLQG